ncbi:hypothetical protein H2198_001540 [Neophaeococcomyces mojaviensis]|uniref:Uncharacterized protein n=1 Tax=Neophaeococcomyces mojaviensis TaxID=3383035 RepID=A0ACC3AGR1_9EURO|nr:hypothetical protein H2198_001540 [Knufia sp. JES_112]
MATKSHENMAMVASSGPALQYRPVDMPSPGSGQAVVEISHVAQNPTDVQSFDSVAFGDGAVYGCDYVGRVVEIGENVSKLKVGDTVVALIWGGEKKGLGAYTHYTLADESIAFKIPSSLDPASASTIPLAVTTAWLALFSKTCLDMERDKPQSVLIWGGSSSVGQFAIQLASLHSLNVITTCSPRNFDLVKSLGAANAFDYNSTEVVERIREAAPNLKFVFDTIGNTNSSAKACEGAAPDCTLCTVRPGKANTEKVPKSVKVTDVLVWTAFLKDHSYGKFRWPANTEDHKLAAELYASLPQWIQDGKIRANDVHLLKGLQSVPKGFQMYREGKISAQKIVYEVR